MKKIVMVLLTFVSFSGVANAYEYECSIWTNDPQRSYNDPTATMKVQAATKSEAEDQTNKYAKEKDWGLPNIWATNVSCH